MALRDFIQIELDVLEATSPIAGDAAMVARFEATIGDMADLFEAAAYDGTEAARVADMLGFLIEHTFKQLPTSPVTGDVSEWEDSGDLQDGVIIYRNKRMANVFKVGLAGDPYYTHAILWRKPDLTTFYGDVINNVEATIHSKQKVNLPFTPNDYLVDVIPNPFLGGLEWKVKDNADLEKVWVYYIAP